MTASDLYYDLVKHALRKDGWRITHNPLRLRLLAHDTQIGQREAAEEPLLVAEKDERKIAVAVKSFVGRYDVEDLHMALARLRRYRIKLRETAPDCAFYLAVRQPTYRDYFAGAVGARLLAGQPMLCMVFDPRTEAIVHWNGLSPVKYG